MSFSWICVGLSQVTHLTDCIEHSYDFKLYCDMQPTGSAWMFASIISLLVMPFSLPKIALCELSSSCTC